MVALLTGSGGRYSKVTNRLLGGERGMHIISFSWKVTIFRGFGLLEKPLGQPIYTRGNEHNLGYTCHFVYESQESSR
jgi:hypothetical protein